MVINAFVDQFVSLGETFFDVATADPVSTVLVVLGLLLTTFAVLAFAYLAVRGAFSGLARMAGS